MSCYGFATPPRKDSRGPSSPQSDPRPSTSSRRFDEAMLTAAKEKAELMDQILRHETANRSLTEQLQAAGDRVAEYYTDIMRANKEKADLAAASASLKAQFEAERERLHQQLKLQEEKNFSLESTNGSLKERISSMERDNASQKERLSVLEKADALHKDNIAKLESAKAELTARVSALEADKSALSGKLARAEAKLKDAQDRLAETEEQRESVEAQLQSENADLKAKNAELESDLSSQRASAAKLSDDTDKLRRELDAKKEELTVALAKEKDAADTNERNKKLQASLEAAQKRIADLINLRDEIEKLRKELLESRELLAVRSAAAALPLPPGLPTSLVVAPPAAAVPPSPVLPAVSPAATALPVVTASAISELDPDNPKLTGSTFERKLGTRGQAALWKGTFGSYDVVFKIPTTVEARKHWDNEIKVLLKVSKPPGHKSGHPNIVSVVEVGNGWFAYLFAKQGDLFSYIQTNGGPLLQELSCSIVQGIAAGLQFMHQKGFIHRNLNSMNVLLMDDRTPLLSDFGLSCSNTDPPKGERVGTPTHMSPEVIRGDPYGEEVDVYALGVIIWEMLAGCPAYRNLAKDGKDAIYSHVLKGGHPEPMPSTGDAKLLELMQHCWDPNPKNRPLIVEFLSLNE